MSLVFNADQDVNAIHGLGQSISQAILANTRGRMIQDRVMQQRESDVQNALLKQAQTKKVDQEISDLIEKNKRAKLAGQAMFELTGGIQAIESGVPTLENGLGLSRADASRYYGESAAMSPAASASMFVPRNVTKGSIGVDALGRETDNRVPYNVPLNAIAFSQDGNLPVARGNIGSASGGFVSPEGKQLVPPAPRAVSNSTPQADVEDLREEKRVMSIPVTELAKMEELDPDQFDYTIAVRRRARARMQSRAQGTSVLPGSSSNNTQTNSVTEPLKVMKIEQVN